MHVFRRRAAVDRLRGLSVRKILILCHGNIIRSPFAAARLAVLIPRAKAIEVLSAGFIGPGRPAHERARSMAADRGIDLSNHVSRLLDDDLRAWSDLIVVMNRRQEQLVGAPHKTVILGDLDPAVVTRRTIPDPYGQDQSVFQESLDRIDRCIRVLASLL
jgi:protein-tyrosine phosphatase